MCGFASQCKSWYERVLGESLLQELLWTEHCEGLSEGGSSSDLRSGSSTWRRGVETFLRRNPCPEVQELVKLARLSNTITDPNLQQTGTQLSHRYVQTKQSATYLAQTWFCAIVRTFMLVHVNRLPGHCVCSLVKCGLLGCCGGSKP